MKAKIYFIITLFLCGFISGSFLSCSKDDNPQKEPDPENNIVETPNSIVGRWVCKKIIYTATNYDNNGYVINETRSETFPNTITEFLSDGTTRGNSCCLYTINGDKLTLCGQSYTFYCDGTHLIYSMVSSSGGFKSSTKFECERFR